MVNRKERYEDLPPKQKAIIDAKAERPDRPNTEIADELDTDRSYVSQVVNAQRHILESEIERRKGGGEREALTRSPASMADELDAAGGATITVELYRDDVLALLEGRVPESLVDSIMNELIEAALDERD